MTTQTFTGEANTKKLLLKKLLDGIKGCQTRFGSRTELATEDDASIRELCSAFEEVFLHGGIRKPISAQPSKGIWQMTESLVPIGLRSTIEYFSFWPLIKLQLSKHEADRFLLLHGVRTDLGRGRAWLRASLNEHSLERYILILLSFENLKGYYEDWAFLRDHELSSILPQAAAGLGSVLFALRVDNPELDNIECGMDRTIKDPIAESLPELAEIADVALSNHTPLDSTGKQVRKLKKKKKTPTAFVAFDDGEVPRYPESGTVSSASSVPSTCLNSPVEKEFDVNSGSPERNQSIKSSTQTKPKVGMPAHSEAKLHSSIEPATATTTLPATPSISIMPGNTDVKEGPTERNSKSSKEATCSTSLKSSDNLSIYSDCSDRIDDVSLSGVSPNQRLKPVGSDLTQGESDPERTHDLIPVPSYTNSNDNEEEVIDNESETNDSCDGMIFSSRMDELSCASHKSVNDSDSVIDKNCNLPARNSLESSTDASLGERFAKLKLVLDHEVDIVTNLKTQMTEMKRQHNDETKIFEARIEATSKENEILKHQLKKYISAVQLLKDGRRRNSLEETDIEVSTHSGVVNNDELNTEGAEYERKLIQVAEMHGELMEFNSYLQEKLQRKDLVIKKLKEELVDLRGPFAAALVGGSEDLVDGDNATQEEPVEGTITRRLAVCNERVLINIWVPSAFLTGATNDLHHVYQVFVRIKDTEWNVYRRYSQFHALHRDLKKKDFVIASFHFPPKKHMGNKDAKFVDERRRKLQEYLRKLMNHTLQTNPILASHPDKNLLISILPFFGEVAPQTLKPRRDRSRGRSLFFRQSGQSSTQRNDTSRAGFFTESNSYTGL